MSLFQFRIALIAGMILNCSFAFAKDLDSANNVMRGCRAFILPQTPPELDLEAGLCAGAIEGLAFLAANVNVCIPPDVTNGQTIRVVVKYIDDRPARLHENFKLLALEAMQAAWPCKK